MTVSEYLHLVRKVYKDFFLVNSLAVDEFTGDWMRRRAEELSFRVDDDFAIWIYASVDQGRGEVYSGCCLAVTDLGIELCTDSPEVCLFYFQEVYYDSNLPTELNFAHSLLKVGEKYYDVLYPDGLLDYRDHILWQEDEVNKFYLLSPSDVIEGVGYQPEPFKLIRGLLSDYI